MNHTLSDWLARHRLPVSFFLFVVLVLEWQLNDGGRPHALLDRHELMPVLGLIFVLAGLLLRSWAAGVIAKRAALATVGPYAFVRHPLYVGSFSIALGFVLIMEDRLALMATLLLYWAIYLPVMRAEERELAQRFGEMWRTYAARTGGVIPRLPLRRVPGEWSWRRWWRNREWRMWPQTALVIAILEGVNTWTRSG